MRSLRKNPKSPLPNRGPMVWECWGRRMYPATDSYFPVEAESLGRRAAAVAEAYAARPRSRRL